METPIVQQYVVVHPAGTQQIWYPAATPAQGADLNSQNAQVGATTAGSGTANLPPSLGVAYYIKAA